MLLVWIIYSWMKSAKTQKSIVADIVDYFLKIILQIFLAVLFSVEGVISIVVFLPW